MFGLIFTPVFYVVSTLGCGAHAAVEGPQAAESGSSAGGRP
ncbi:MAG: hypothetical protein WDN76_10530 [Alphaproteobacteria bacterium]